MSRPRLLAAAATPQEKTRRRWPERDPALVAGLAEALSLTLGSFDGPPGERRLDVVGKDDRALAIPIYPELDYRYLASRAERFPAHELGHQPRDCSRYRGVGKPGS